MCNNLEVMQEYVCGLGWSIDGDRGSKLFAFLSFLVT